MKGKNYRLQVLCLVLLFTITGINAQVIKSEKSYLQIASESSKQVVEIKDEEPPELKIISPQFNEENKLDYSSPEINIIGKALDNEKISSVIVNSEVVALSESGVFSIKQMLYPGENEIIIVAMDANDNFLENRFHVNYTPVKVSFEDKIKEESKYYALIIGVNKYKDPQITDLDNPINDAQKIYDVLTNYYSFDPENTIFIKDASREDIINALDDLGEKVTPNDNVLIFYAGHGWWDEDANVGYWLPSDAKRDSKAAWFSNSRLVDYLKAVKSKHTLLIADACFTGSIFKTRSAFSDASKAIQKLYELPSRKAMTSGTLTEVPDRSAFTNFLCERLTENTEKCISSEQLFSSIRIAVINNSDAIPQYGEIRNVGDQGGDFIFIRK